jgi:hypothetical protein
MTVNIVMVRLYCAFLISLVIICLTMLSTSLHFPALGFHTESTRNLTINMQGGTPGAAAPPSFIVDNNGSLPIEIATEIYNSTNNALQALNEGNTSAVYNQLNFTKEILLSIISKNGSAQQGQELNTTQAVARPTDISNMDVSGDIAINSPEDIATVETDTQIENQEAIERETTARSDERR